MLQRVTYSRAFPERIEVDLKNFLESLNLHGIESWDKLQQQSVRDLLVEYQHLFTMNLSELGKTSLVQHNIKLDDMTPFKEHY